ncbi:MAG: hypothetical protein JEZ02_03940 [Desulfatibacillum sp.]|nr:hypothetical protein [Desulfatibacillum sp.]
MTNKTMQWIVALAITSAMLSGCATGGYSGLIPIAGTNVGADTPERRMAALNAAEQVLLSKGYSPVRVEKNKGYMNFILEADTDTMHHVNVRLVEVQSGKNNVEMDVNVRILRTEPERTGLSVGGGIGIGAGGGGGFGFGIATPSQEWSDDDTKLALKKEIAAAVEKALAQ